MEERTEKVKNPDRILLFAMELAAPRPTITNSLIDAMMGRYVVLKSIATVVTLKNT